MTKVIYILRDPRVPEVVKIGKNSTWPERLRQAQSHTPGGCYLVGAWILDSASPAELNAAEHAAQSSLPTWSHPDAREWYSVRPADAIAHVRSVFSRPPDVIREPAVLTAKPYDAWRTLGDTKRDGASDGIRPYRRRLWIFREKSSFGNVKVIHSIDFDCFFTYAFTYNPFPVRLVDCWQTIDNFNGPDARYAQGNRRIVDLWEETLRRFGASPDQRCCGWLPNEVTLSQVRAHLHDRGLAQKDLRAPKGRDCPYRGSSTQALPLDVTPQQNRIEFC
jgi:hypothetical protein